MIKLPMGETEYGALARTLRKVDFFEPLTVGQLEKVVPYILLYAYGAGDTVFRQGEASDAFYVVYSGKVSVQVKAGFFSRTKTVTTLGAGDFFGEMALLSRDPRSASVSCDEDSRIFVLLAGDFEFILKENPTFATEVGRIAARRRFSAQHDR